jgi:hypothetical protein
VDPLTIVSGDKEVSDVWGSPGEGGKVVGGAGVASGDPGGVLLMARTFLFARSFFLKVFFAGEALTTSGCPGPTAFAFFLFCLYISLTLPSTIS